MDGNASRRKYYAKAWAVTKDYRSRSGPRPRREIAVDQDRSTCKESRIGAHFADISSGCSTFFICVPGDDVTDRPVKVALTCMDGYLFDQKAQNCEKASQVNCKKSVLNDQKHVMGIYVE